MSSVAEKVGDDPVLFPELDGLDAQAEQLAPAKSASDQHGEDRVVSFGTERIAIRTRQKPPALVGREPISDSHADAAQRGQAEVSRCCCVLLLLKMDSVSQHDAAIEREARL